MIESRIGQVAEIVDDMKFSGTPCLLSELLNGQGDAQTVMKKPPVRDAVFRKKLIQKGMDFIGPPSKDSKRMFRMVFLMHLLRPPWE